VLCAPRSDELFCIFVSIGLLGLHEAEKHMLSDRNQLAALRLLLLLLLSEELTAVARSGPGVHVKACRSISNSYPRQFVSLLETYTSGIL
jgi:hypothetical protein